MQNRTIVYNNHSWNVQIQDEADESVANEIFKFREYKMAEESIISAQSCILDVGAHRGFFTLYARSLNPTVPIYALEPEPANQEAFRSHMEHNSVPGVTLVPKALFATTGKSKLVVTADSHNHVLELVDTPAGGRAIVSTTTLADLLAEYSLPSVDLLKMDIEGAEYPILESLDADTWGKIRRIILEYHTVHRRKPSELEQLLRENGFGVQKYPSSFDKTMGFFLARNKRLKEE